MNYHVLTLFPEMIEQGLRTSIIGRALADGTVTLETVNIRDHTQNKHGKTDDYPYGGGAGMVMQAQPVYDAYMAVRGNLKKEPRVIYVTPQGRVFNQAIARELAVEEDLVFICGHYEGIDERVLDEIVTDHISIGDYVLTGGELPAMVMIDAISRMIPGVLHNMESAEDDSFGDGLLEHPQYTKPREYRGMNVPEVLVSGNHKLIELWKFREALLLTKKRRPDLFEDYIKSERSFSKDERKILEEIIKIDI